MNKIPDGNDLLFYANELQYCYKNVYELFDIYWHNKQPVQQTVFHYFHFQPEKKKNIKSF